MSSINKSGPCAMHGMLRDDHTLQEWMECDASRRSGERDAPRGETCHSGKDGECNWAGCPQTRDNEPARSGRYCPLDVCATCSASKWEHNADGPQHGFAASAPPPERAAPPVTVGITDEERALFGVATTMTHIEGTRRETAVNALMASAYRRGLEAGRAAPPRAHGRAETEAIELAAFTLFADVNHEDGPLYSTLAEAVAGWGVAPDRVRDHYRRIATDCAAALRATPAANTESD